MTLRPNFLRSSRYTARSARSRYGRCRGRGKFHRRSGAHAVGLVSMTAPIAVNSDELTTAANGFLTVQTMAQQAVVHLTGVLNVSGGSAGSDKGGKAFSTQVDPAVFDAVDAGSALVMGAGMLHDLLHATAVNHTNANTQSKVEPNPNDLVFPPGSAPPFAVPPVPKLYGGPANEPTLWGVIRRWVQGEIWPNGKPDQLHTAAAAFRSAATGLRDSGRYIPNMREGVARQRSAEIPQALAQIDLLVSGLESTASTFDVLGQACSELADAIEAARHAIMHSLVEFASVSVAAEVAGGVGAIFSFGVAEGGAQAAVAAAGALYGARIVGFCRALAAAAEASALPSIAAAGAAGRIVQDLGPLLSARVLLWGAESIGAIPAMTAADRFPYRPYIRAATRKDVLDRTEVMREPDGTRYWLSETDDNVRIPVDGTYPSSVTSLPKDERGWYYLAADGTRYPVDPTPVMGHSYGDEWWRIQQMAFEKKWTNQQLNDYVNDPANEIFQLEDAPGNWSHRFEMPREKGK